MFQSDSDSVLEEAEHDPSIWEVLERDMQAELEQSKKELEEITLLIEQSQLEVNKLAQRNASITADLQQVISQFDTLPREEIRATYDSALDAQQRLFVMRGQLEKLQSDQKYLERLISVMRQVKNALDGGTPMDVEGKGGSFGAVEMMIQAQESERQRLSRQMHDGPAQALSNFILQTEIAMRLFDVDAEKARGELVTLKGAATTTFQQVREFIFELRPMMLDDLGFVPTIKRYVDALKDQTGMDLVVQVTGAERRLESYREVLIFRAIQELVSNAMRHSQANQIRVQIDIGDHDVRTSVDDNGKGIDPQILEADEGVGLKIIRERVEMLGGTFSIDTVPEQGTRVTFQVSAESP